MSKTVKRKQAEMGYERKPARCANCIHFHQGMWGPKNVVEITPRCMLGNFNTGCHAVCDKWQGRDGATVE